ncbi:MAG: hypothetical protein K6C13_13340 [Oscillospiraceae bacterium]|nr:hypothetical protein [Oscillospiraceae bacterium]
MKIKEFCQIYGLSRSAVYERIKNNENGALEGHIICSKDAAIELDEVAIEFLRPKADRCNKNNTAALNDMSENIKDISDFVHKHKEDTDKSISERCAQLEGIQTRTEGINENRLLFIEEWLRNIENSLCVLICRVYDIPELHSDRSSISDENATH